jgi:hypothetical protein
VIGFAIDQCAAWASHASIPLPRQEGGAYFASRRFAISRTTSVVK